MVTVADIIEYRLRNETMVQRIAEARMPTAFGEFRACVYRNRIDYSEHLVLAMGHIDPENPVLVRAHREYLPGDVFGYTKRNTRGLLRAGMRPYRRGRLRRHPVLEARVRYHRHRYQRQVRRRAHRASTRINTPEADFRDYGIGAQILRDIGVRKMVMLTDRPPRLANLPGYGLEIVDYVPLSAGGEAPLD